MVREIDIRNTLRDRLKKENKSPSLVLDELGLCQGSARIDLAVINGALHGYEIKSAQDTLKRLPAQGEVYSRIFDTVVIVAPREHLDKIKEIVPDWWGLIDVQEFNGKPALINVREKSQNPSVDPFSLAQLLWRDEALQVLEEHGLVKGFRSKPNDVLWGRLADQIPLTELSHIVRQRLKIREGWRSDGVRV